MTKKEYDRRAGGIVDKLDFSQALELTIERFESIVKNGDYIESRCVFCSIVDALACGKYVCVECRACPVDKICDLSYENVDSKEILKRLKKPQVTERCKRYTKKHQKHE